MKYLRNQPLKKHTSFKIGGPAKVFCHPKNVEELKEALAFAREKHLPILVIGAGTNLLALDRGFRGLVIKLAQGLNGIKIKGTKAYVGAGMLLPRLMTRLVHKGLGNLEFLAGIPGSVGGAVVMNAGAWGKEIGKYVEQVKVLDHEGREITLRKKQLEFAYRKSSLQKKPWVVIEVVFKLRKSPRKSLKNKIKDHLSQRKNNQPLGSPNCGSIFKNPKGNFSGRLIEEAGCKGMRVGDAQVSCKHANFILNLGEAKAKDVLKLITRIQKAVRPKLELEIEIVS